MHGLGNDYIVLDNRDEKLQDDEISGLARRLCTRRVSVGADGLLLIYNSTVANVKMREFNPDGTEAEMCGNGTRCFVKFCYEKGLFRKKVVDIETLSGIRRAWLSVKNDKVVSVKVDMGAPTFERRAIPMIGDGVCINEELKVDRKLYNITCLSIGNPHCVIFVKNTKVFPVKEVGPKLEVHKAFPNRINVEFVQIINRREINVRVWERGVGETLACGTGACASVVACVFLQKTEKQVTAHLLGGDLIIQYDNNILMDGSASWVYVAQLL